MSAVDWPLNIGGKPFASLPAFVPVTFEMGILLASLATLLAFFVRTRLYPGGRPHLEAVRRDPDHFAVTVLADPKDPSARNLFQQLKAASVHSEP